VDRLGRPAAAAARGGAALDGARDLSTCRRASSSSRTARRLAWTAPAAYDRSKTLALPTVEALAAQ